jgi:hypothetical protein
MATMAGMKTSFLFLFTMVLAMALLPAAAQAQALPDNPAPAPDPLWSWVENLARGEEIVVKPAAGRSVHCRFAGATDAYLFCDPDNMRSAASGYRFDRAQVADVQLGRAKVNWHPAPLVIASAVGIATGLALSSLGTTDKSAAAGGILTATMVGGIGYSVALAQDRYRGFAFSAPLPVFSFAGPRVRGIMHWNPR